jgi:hypothetical protein
MGNNIPNVNQPFNPPGGGYYEMSFKSGLITGVAAASELFQFRFHSVQATNILKRAELKFLKIDFICTTGFTGAQVIDFSATVARAFTANGTGGTQSLPPANMQKRKTQYPNSEITANGDIRIATTAALGVGTKTLDTFPFASITGYAAAAGAGKVLSSPFQQEYGEHHVPIVFQDNEGFVIQALTAFGAVGVGVLYVDIGWMEVIDDGMKQLW